MDSIRITRRRPRGTSGQALLACLALLALLSALPARAQEFRDIGAGLPGVFSTFGGERAQASFNDFDKDGDVDVLLAGPETITDVSHLRIYRNTGGRYSLFTDFSAAGANRTGGAAWADVDHDGFAEVVSWKPFFVMDSLGGSDSGAVQVFSYDPATDAFQPRDLPLSAPGIWRTPLIQFVDYDGDGFQDLMFSGWRRLTRSGNDFPSTRILRNNAGAGFTDTAAIAFPTANAVAAWNDIDFDGDQDLFLSGTIHTSPTTAARSARVFKYDAGQFNLYATLSVNFDIKSAAMADYYPDSAGDLAICGGTPNTTRLYWNTGAGFAVDGEALAIPATGAPNANLGSVAFGDPDNDGDPDLLISGEFGFGVQSHFTRYYENSNGGYFNERDLKLPPFWNSSTFFADFDNDGNEDIFMTGTTTNEQGQLRIKTLMYRNIRGDFDVAADIDTLSGKRARWGDFDNDGDMDLAACGTSGMDGVRRCRLYRNDAGSFARVATPFDGLYGDPEWGDYDRDGRVDLLLAGNWGPEGRLRVFRNAGGGGFAEIPIEEPLSEESNWSARIGARWGDYDQDGDLDILAWGEYALFSGTYDNCFAEVLVNQGGGRFVRAEGNGMPRLCGGELEWGDYDRDGDLDVLFSGDTLTGAGNNAFTAVFRNVDGALAKTDDLFLGLSNARASWGDFDQDGDLDFAIAGSDLRSSQDANLPTTWIYRLVGGRFEEYWKGSGLIGDVAWIDYDNDGDLDLLNSGRYFFGLPANVNVTLVLRNNGLVFTSFSPFTTLFAEDNYVMGELDAADFDNDGDVDFVVAGRYMLPHSVGDGVSRLRVYRNTLVAPNWAPAVPAGLTSALGLASADLSWSGAADEETKGAALQYNLRVGTSPGALDVVSPAAESPGGRRLLPGPANAGRVTSARLKGLAPGTYYWSVQSVDNQTAGSAFAAERSFTLGLPAPQLVEAVPGPGTGKVTLRWNRLSQPHFKRYYLHYGSAAGPEARLDSLVRSEDTVFTVSGLENGAPWYFRVSAADQGGNVTAFSNELSAIPDGSPPAIPAGLAAAPGDRSITLTWDANTESDFLCYLVYQRNASGPVVKIDSITDVGATSRTIAGLKNGTPYSFMVVAVDRILNYSGFSGEAVAIPAYLLTPSSPSVAFGKAPLDGRLEASLSIRNTSGLPVPVDSVRFVGGAFGMAGDPGAFPAQAETTLTLIFAPDKPAGGDFAGVFKIYYGGSAAPLEIELSGSATAPPHCSIDKIVPADLAWDTTTAISFLASAYEPDNAGVGDRITAYLWSSSLAGPLDGNASGFTLRPDQLGLGVHEISLRVVDNEGDTSLAALSSVAIRSLKPLVRIEAISPAGLILRGADPVRIRCEAHDRDEQAGPGKRDLQAFALHSTLQGRLSGDLDTTFEPSALSLGVHGFYAVAVDDEGDTAVSDTAFVPVQAGVGLALLVAGTDFNDNRYFYENIAPNCNWVYSRLRQRGFTDSLITYFNPVGWQSIGADYHQDSRIVDVTDMTAANLRDRVLGFKDRVRSGVPLLLSFLGHGGRADKQNGKFYLSPTEYLDPDSLDAWLDTYNQDASGQVTDSLATPIVIVLDFCFSGSFFPKLRSSTQNRVVITSSAVDRQAYFQNGRSFSYALFRQIEKGGNLTEAWVAGKTWSDANTVLGLERANPLANADNDNTANESEDFAHMNQIYVGGSQQEQGPEATWKDVQLRYEGGGILRIQAYPEAKAAVDTAWFTMLPPDFKPPQAGAVDPFVAGGLLRQADGSYAGTVKLEPVLAGDYLFIVYGIKDGEEMMPVSKRANPTPVGLTRASGIPERFDLGRNYPNPAVSTTFIPLAVTRLGRVELTVRGMDGRLVKRLASGTLSPGYYLMQWDGRDERGRKMAPGVYTYLLQSAEGVRRRTLVWAR